MDGATETNGSPALAGKSFFACGRITGHIIATKRAISVLRLAIGTRFSVHALAITNPKNKQRAASARWADEKSSMCEYIHTQHVMPGYICCRCRSYNGMQRRRIDSTSSKLQTACKFGCVPLCEVIPTDKIAICAHCFGAQEKNPDGSVSMPLMNGAGKRFNPRFCPICQKPWEELTVTIKLNLTGAKNP